jgi:L-alanine-DL-glutamate epimerase-like enolase superfamily enzyme
MITRLTSPAFSICAEVHVPAPLNVYRHRADLIQEFGRRNATFWVSWKVPARGERRLLTRIRAAAGFSAIKLKLGFGIYQDVGLCQAVRKAVADWIGTMVDANHAYDASGAERRCHLRPEPPAGERYELLRPGYLA